MIARDVELQTLARGLDPLDVLLVAVAQDKPQPALPADRLTR